MWENSMANTNTREDRNVGQAAREAARTVASEAQQFAHSTANMGEGAVRAGTELMQRNAEIMQQIWETGRNMTSQFTDTATNPLFRAVNMSDAEAQKAAQQSARNMEAVLESSTVVAQEFQNISREWLDFLQSRWQQTLSHMNDLGRCRTPQDAAAIQSELMRDTFEHLLQSARRTAEISARMADAATRKISENVNRERRAA